MEAMGSEPGLDCKCVRFGVFELNPSSGELRKHGVRVRLQEQPLKLLLYLLETPGEICSREALIQGMWPEGTFVDYDRGLNSAVTRLRQVIGDSADAPRYIETVGRKGYRFIAPVERTPPAETRSPSEPAGRQTSPLARTAEPVPQASAQQHKSRSSVTYLLVLAIGLTAGAAIGWWLSAGPSVQQLVRLSIDLEPGMVPAGPGTALALAPDGTRVALAVRCDDGKIRLATRRLDQSHITPLPGTEGATSPFFSPDGRWIAFFADERLKKVAVQGGLPTTLANASTFDRGPHARFPAGNWSDDGNIIAMLKPADGLMSVPSAGGSPTPLKGLQKRDDEIDNWPQVLPRSQTVLFTRNKGDYDSASIEIFSLKSREQKTVLKGGFFGRYLPGGYLVYIHRNTLFVVSFDPNRLAVTGTPQPVLEDVNSRLSDWSFDFAKTGRFAYLNHEVEPQQYIFSIDSAGRTSQLPAPAESSNASPRFSPDGLRLAFSRSTRGRQDIWVLDLNRGAASRLTALPGINDSPVWTPDGLNVIFRSIDQSKPGIYGVRADGSGEARRLLELTSGELPSSVSPDGTRLAIWAGGKIWLAPVETVDREVSIGTPVQFLQTRFSPTVPGRMAPAVSPDGRWLAYCSNESEQLEVYVVPFLRPGRKCRISIRGGMFPAWSRNGRELFFQDLESHRPMVATYKTSEDSFVAERPRVWSDIQILDLGVHHSYDVAPDGKRLAAVLYAGGTAEWKRSTKVAFLLNFFDELRHRVTTEGN